jgi:hypothetical protein
VVMTGNHKMTSGSEESFVFWCNEILARRTLSDLKVHWLDKEHSCLLQNRRWELLGAT